VKGITHFAVGVAVATFFPEIVTSAAQNLAFGPVLGGVAGLLPDTLDFKLLRYLEQPDAEIDPARMVTADGRPDPQAMAEGIAALMDRAYEDRHPATLRLHTLKLGSDLWQRWSLALDPGQGRVCVRLGPAVTTGQIPLPGSHPSGTAPGVATVRAPFLYSYDPEIVIDIFSGPSLSFRRSGDGLEVTFLPWHRAWSHSLPAALLLGGLAALLAPIYGLVAFLAVLAHALLDQLGAMGNNLLYPLTRRRTPGLGLVRSGDPLPNFLTVWLSVVLILFNLDRFSPAPVLPAVPYLLLAAVLPTLLCLGAWLWRRRRVPSLPPAGQVMDEMGQVDI
jgi:membrane-bound metal-dependent hydrolase YbcI (DUF457 family)